MRHSRGLSCSPSAVIEWTLACADRSALRRAVAEKWLEESPYTNYRYNVERCANGSRVYLLRPTWLNAADGPGHADGRHRIEGSWLKA